MYVIDFSVVPPLHYTHKKRTILIAATYIKSNLPSNVVAAVQKTEHLLPGVGGAQNKCVQ